MAAIEINPTVVPPLGNPIVCAMIGGETGAPEPPALTPLATGLPRAFVIDHAARFAYFVETSGALSVLDLSGFDPSGVTAITRTQILAGSAFAGTLQYLTISPDNSKLYATVSNNTVVSILTAAPYTVTVLASGFGTLSGIDYDVTNNLLRVWDGTAGGPASVTLAGVVTQHGGIVASIVTPLAVGKSGSPYFVNSTQIRTGGTVPVTLSDAFATAPCVDDFEPGEFCLYFVASPADNSGGSTISRQTLNPANLTAIATLPNLISVGQDLTTAMFYRYESFDPTVNPALYLVDHIGILWRIEA